MNRPPLSCRCAPTDRGLSIQTGAGRRLRGTALAVVAMLAGCAGTGLRGGPEVAPDSVAEPAAVVEADGANPPSAPVPAGWHRLPLPGKRQTDYRQSRVAGRPAIHARSVRSASMLRRPWAVQSEALSDFRFSWWVPALVPGAVPGDRDRDDAPVRVVLAFDGDHTRLPMRERLQFDLAEVLTGERPPYATLMYVWDPVRAPDEIVVSDRSGRVRKVVVESGPQRLRRWLDYRRDVRADFERAYGEPPGRLLAVGVMTDSDNTQTQAEAWYGELGFVSPAR